MTGRQLMQAIDFGVRGAGELCACMERALIAGGNPKRVQCKPLWLETMLANVAGRRLRNRTVECGQLLALEIDDDR